MQLLNYLLLYWKPITWSSIFIILTCLSNRFFILPISGMYLASYVLIIATSTTWLSFKTIQCFLILQYKPLELKRLLKFNRKNRNHLDNYKAIKQITIDIDQYFIQKWYVSISKDTTFNQESCVILEEILKKMMHVLLSLDKEIVVHSVFNLYLKHLKEFRRSLKRKEKYSGTISKLYRYSHICSSSHKAKNYFIHQLTINLLNHFINWELSNSLPYHILVAIISKKVLTYLLNLISNPEFLNYNILRLCASNEKKIDLNIDNYNLIKIIQVTERDGEATPSDLDKSSSLANIGAPVIDSGSSATIIDEYNESTNPEELKFEDVKIFEPKSCKSWYDSYDLHSVTVGEDILSILNSPELDNNEKSAPENESKEEVASSPISSAKYLLDEVKYITTLEGFKTSIKPISEVTATTFNNIRDLQETTVNNVVKPMSQATSTAFHKIGGLHLQDEAAGVVEGILDFGRTRIRKGLRLTGLQESPEEAVKAPPVHTKKQITKMTRVTDESETTWINPLQEEGVSHLNIPSILTHEDGSPEPEYEETADLATSIAKLRSLLEQKSSESNFSTPALSPMPSEEVSTKILMDSEDGIEEADGMVPSFSKLCAKTFSQIKSSLTGGVAECERWDKTEKWLFYETNISENDLSVRMQKLLCERKVFCTVDTAYEAIDSLGSSHIDKLEQLIQFEDELDDIEVKLPMTKGLFDIFCELLADTKDTSLAQEPVIRAIILIFGNYIEDLIKVEMNYYLQFVCANATIPSESKSETLSLELDDFVSIMLSRIPDYLKFLIGEQTLKNAANLFISSLQVQKINQDIFMQILEILCLKLMDGSKQMTPISA